MSQERNGVLTPPARARRTGPMRDLRQRKKPARLHGAPGAKRPDYIPAISSCRPLILVAILDSIVSRSAATNVTWPSQTSS
jgi:hypothetical protein